MNYFPFSCDNGDEAPSGKDEESSECSIFFVFETSKRKKRGVGKKFFSWKKTLEVSRLYWNRQAKSDRGTNKREITH